MNMLYPFDINMIYKIVYNLLLLATGNSENKPAFQISGLHTGSPVSGSLGLFFQFTEDPFYFLEKDFGSEIPQINS